MTALRHAAFVQRKVECGKNSFWRLPASGPYFTPGRLLVCRSPIIPCRPRGRKCPRASDGGIKSTSNRIADRKGGAQVRQGLCLLSITSWPTPTSIASTTLAKRTAGCSSRWSTWTARTALPCSAASDTGLGGPAADQGVRPAERLAGHPGCVSNFSGKQPQTGKRHRTGVTLWFRWRSSCFRFAAILPGDPGWTRLEPWAVSETSYVRGLDRAEKPGGR